MMTPASNNNPGKKAQSTMEFLMTYGWAIFVVIILAAAFYAIGLFGPAAYAGHSVTGFQVLGPMVDWELTSANGNLTLNLQNGRMSTPVTIISVKATMSGDSISYVPEGLVIKPGETNTISFPFSQTLPAGSTYSIHVAITYNSGGLDHTDVGIVTGSVN